MSRDASITLAWADDDYVFRLAWGELVKLQEATGFGPPFILDRMEGRVPNDSWHMEDVSHIIRLGLIGGGLEPAKALKLTRQYVESRPPMENVKYAHAILMAGLFGAPDEDALKKNFAAETANELTASLTENSASDTSTAPPPP